MRTGNWVTSLIAIGVVVAILGGILLITRNNPVRLSGEVLKVRTQMLDETSSLAVLDVRIVNPSNQQLMVKDIAVKITSADGKVSDGEVLSDSEAIRIFEYFKALGPKYNPSLMLRNRIHSGQQLDRTLVVKFVAPEVELAKRKSLRIEISDADGAIAGFDSVNKN